MRKYVCFDSIRSDQDLDLYLGSVSVGSPTVRTNYVDIPGADGLLDLSEALGGVTVVTAGSRDATPVKTRVRAAGHAIARLDEACGPAGEIEVDVVRDPVGTDDGAALLRLDAGEVLSRHVRSAPRVGVRIRAARCWRRRQPCQPTLSGPARS